MTDTHAPVQLPASPETTASTALSAFEQALLAAVRRIPSRPPVERKAA